MEKIREFKRGDVYYIKYDGSVGSEMAVGKPVVIISSDEYNEENPVVLCAMMTSNSRLYANRVAVVTNGRSGTVVCDNIRCYDKSRFETFMCTLPEEKMAEITNTIAEIFDITKVTDAAPQQVVVNCDTDIVALKVELDTYKKLYEKAVDKIAELKFEKPIIPEGKIATVEEEKPKSSPVTVFKRKANVNFDTAETISEVTGMSIQTAEEIVRRRNKYGKYRTLVDLLDVPRFGSGCMDKYGNYLEV